MARRGKEALPSGMQTPVKPFAMDIFAATVQSMTEDAQHAVRKRALKTYRRFLVMQLQIASAGEWRDRQPGPCQINGLTPPWPFATLLHRSGHIPSRVVPT
jgi:hypothetical protein